MPDGQVLEFDRVTKRFGDATAVSDFSGRVEPGAVTAFLGPNGAGKTTTLRMLLGQLRPTSGTATIGGAQYADLKHPARVIGAMHEDPGFRPRRTVERHLILAAKANGIALSRVGEVIAFVGLDGEADSRIGTLSLGMRQRLSAATALLGDPGALVLDEPANGLDPEGIRWMRMLIRGLADEGRTVLISSHVLSEVEQIADEILIIAHGQRKFAGSLAALADPTAGPVVVDAVDRAALTAALTAAGFDFEVLRSGLTVRGSDAATIGAVAARAGVALATLQQRGPTLEDVFLDLVNGRPVQLRKPETTDAVDAPETLDATTALPVIAAEPADDEAPDAAATDVAEEPAVEAPPADVASDLAQPEETQSEETQPEETQSEESASTENVDGDEDEVAADETAPISSFAPVSAAEDRPLPGVTGLAAAAASLSQTADDAEPLPVSDAWAALITGRPSEETPEPVASDETADQDAAATAPSDAAWTPEPQPAVAAEQQPAEVDAEQQIAPAEHAESSASSDTEWTPEPQSPADEADEATAGSAAETTPEPVAEEDAREAADAEQPGTSDVDWTSEPRPAAEHGADEPTETADSSAGEALTDSADVDTDADAEEPDTADAPEPEYTEFAHEAHVAEDGQHDADASEIISEVPVSAAPTEDEPAEDAEPADETDATAEFLSSLEESETDDQAEGEEHTENEEHRS